MANCMLAGDWVDSVLTVCVWHFVEACNWSVELMHFQSIQMTFIRFSLADHCNANAMESSLTALGSILMFHRIMPYTFQFRYANGSFHFWQLMQPERKQHGAYVTIRIHSLFTNLRIKWLMLNENGFKWIC